MTKIKVCGIQNNQLLAALQDVSIDSFGFVFAPSKRRIEIAEANLLIAEIRAMYEHPPQCVGVFRNQSESELINILEAVPLDVAQLHGDESPAFCARIRELSGTPIMKAFSLQPGSSSIEIIRSAQSYVGVIDTILIDTYDPTYGGGSGKTFRWDVIDDIKAWCSSVQLPLFVAGGLHSDNVVQLLNQHKPYGVDVSSGVETSGEKDLLKIITFVERVRAYDYGT
jgi:phosphoribosylanthranilate isomerase